MQICAGWVLVLHVLSILQYSGFSGNSHRRPVDHTDNRWDRFGKAKVSFVHSFSLRATCQFYTVKYYTVPWQKMKIKLSGTVSISEESNEADKTWDSIIRIELLYILYYRNVFCLFAGPTKPQEVEPGLIRPVCDLFCFFSEKYKTMCWCGVNHAEDKLVRLPVYTD